MSKAEPVGDLRGYELLLAVTGGIAAYKVCQVCSMLVQRGCGVTVAMTDAATRFVGPLTFQALSGRPVYVDLWRSQEHYDPHHLGLTDRADLVLVAPATANILGKMACGIGDDLVSTLMLAVDSPVLIAPAMNSRMWGNPIVQKNVAALKAAGYRFIDPGQGWLACRASGPGRLAEVETLVATVGEALVAIKPKGPGRGASR